MDGKPLGCGVSGMVTPAPGWVMAPEAKRELLARLLQMLRDAMLVLLKVSKPPAQAVVVELRSLTKDMYQGARPKLVKIGSALIVGSVLTATAYVAGPLATLAEKVPQLKEISEVVKSLKDIVDK
ncbi:hypothetical protein SAMN05880556_101816 [Azospirillum sp. RU38E]|nr:hypothetical protein SAMN05880556_101816 [Azospirillum sp. RU38E]SNS13033.1 hypothetical protein SAMN05880591_101816 [Azospirillum sp. RU37A]